MLVNGIPGEANMIRWSELSLVPVVAYHLFGAHRNLNYRQVSNIRRTLVLQLHLHSQLNTWLQRIK